TVCSRWVWVESGTSMFVSAEPTSPRGAMTRVRWSARTMLTGRSILASTAFVSKGSRGLCLRWIPSSIFSARGWEASTRRGSGADEGTRLGGPDREGLAVDHLDPLLGELAESLLDLHLRQHQRRVARGHRPDLLALRPAADVGQPRVDRVPPSGVDGRDELHL